MIRVCPKRDAVCPHGLSCPYTKSKYECHNEPSADTFHGRSRESLIEEIRELRAALEPFSKMAGELFARNGQVGDIIASRVRYDGVHFDVRYEHFHAARQAMEPKP